MIPGGNQSTIANILCHDRDYDHHIVMLMRIMKMVEMMMMKIMTKMMMMVKPFGMEFCMRWISLSRNGELVPPT